jgi:serine/threonine-protein kinase
VSDWPFAPQPRSLPRDYLASVGEVFATFDSRTQDSGNVSYGVAAGGRRWFVKTAGSPAAEAFLNHAQRMELLENAQRVAASLTHPALPTLHNVLPSAWGPMLVYDWVPGELLGGKPEHRADPASAHQRLRRLPVAELTAAFDTMLDVHVQLEAQGWVACDLYDGALIYDFEARQLNLVDLDTYHRGPFVNEMGRMFGSTRFMAPEEFEKGAAIDWRTTVFTLGRHIAVFLSDGTLERAPFRGSDAQHAAVVRACQPAPRERFPTVADFAAAWRG